jgi:hypothetical protein
VKCPTVMPATSVSDPADGRDVCVRLNTDGRAAPAANAAANSRRV